MINTLFKRKVLKVFFVIFLFLPFSTFSQASHYDDYCVQSSKMVKLLEEHHVSPPEINDEFSSKVFQSLIKTLDPYKLYFSEKNINELKEFEYSIDDELKSSNCRFLKKLIPLYKKKLQFGDSLVENFLSKPISYQEDINIVFESKSTSTYAKTNQDLKKRWIKWIKYLTLESMAKSHSIQNENSLFTKKSLLKFEEESRNKIGKKYSSHFQSFLEDNEFYEDLIAEIYFISITTTFDPHSMYLSPELKENIIGSLSKEEKSFGIEFEENELGDIEVVRLVPGGPSWKSNQINIGDILLGIKQKGNNWIDLSFISVEELENQLLTVSEKTTFKIQKLNGQKIEVPLIKELIRADENIIKSFILKGEKSIGYISLPGFYTEFESEYHLGCANDIAKSILKMQKENIEGLIIDLRNNTGGSLKEAIDLSGVFIDFGPLSIAKTKGEKPTTVKDLNRGSIYNDPLLIMVNGMSASASELFSATMQDYNRAVIVGSTTFGKATGQTIVPLALDTKKENDHYLDNGFIKVTDIILYRLNCNSYQKNGVHPDIPLPYLSGKEFKESDYPSSLNADSIFKKIYMPEISQLPYEELLVNSKKRIESDSTFIKIKAANDLLNKEYIDTLLIPLSLKGYIEYQNDNNSIKNGIFEELEGDSTSIFSVNEITYDNSVLQMDDYTKEINQIIIHQLEMDVYLKESFHIIMDLINYQNK